MGLIMEGVKIRHAKEENRLNREFQLMMSSTSHQRGVADLKAAGLNPILSATSAMGAAMGSGSSVAAGGSSGSMMDEATSALGLKTQTNVHKQQAEDLGLTSQQRATSKSLAANQNSNTVKNKEEFYRIRAQRHLLEAQEQDQLNRNVGSALDAQINRNTFMRGMKYAERGLPFVNTLVGAATARAIGRGRGLSPGGGVLRRPDGGGGPSSARSVYRDDPRGNRVRRGPGTFNESDIPY